MAKIIVDVHLKAELLDPQGRAISGALSRLGLNGVTEVRQGKQFIIELEGEVTEDTMAKLHELASNLLSNPVIENYELKVLQ
ncbi:MAG: phosphoribosylformylglycinamidine synthase subunit PurS [Actinomycetota bacterium]|jgi:phosphoribosylformylglycinamidine synthase